MVITLQNYNIMLYTNRINQSQAFHLYLGRNNFDESLPESFFKLNKNKKKTFFKYDLI